MGIGLGLTGAGYTGGSFGSYSSLSSYGYNTERQLEYRKGRKEVNEFDEAYDEELKDRDSIVNQNIRAFVKHLKDGHEDEAFDAYNKLLEEMKLQSRYDDCKTDEGYRAKAQEKIEEYLTQQNDGEFVDLSDFIKQNAADKVDQHNQLCSTWDDSIVDKTTEEELLNIICGEHNEIRESGYQFGDICRNIFASFWNWASGRRAF